MVIIGRGSIERFEITVFDLLIRKLFPGNAIFKIEYKHFFIGKFEGRKTSKSFSTSPTSNECYFRSDISDGSTPNTPFSFKTPEKNSNLIEHPSRIQK